jgi:thiol:disulfide interchange protein DsbD
VIFAVFFAVGIGMSLPYPAARRRAVRASILPRPGAWMNTFKGLMGFLLAGAAIWLFYVLAAQLDAARAGARPAAAARHGALRLAAPPEPDRRRDAQALGPRHAALRDRRAGGRGPRRPRELAQRDARRDRDAALIAWQPWDEATAEALAAEAARSSSTSPPTGASPAR